jgi:hypothetical protein
MENTNTFKVYAIGRNGESALVAERDTYEGAQKVADEISGSWYAGGIFTPDPAIVTGNGVTFKPWYRDTVQHFEYLQGAIDANK